MKPLNPKLCNKFYVQKILFNACYKYLLSFVIVLFLTLFSSAVSAQSRLVTGRVLSEETQEVLSGAEISYQNGQGKEVYTNEAGVFTIEVPNNISTINVIVNGGEATDFKIANANGANQNIGDILVSVYDFNNLDDIVVTGYTAQSKKSITGGVSIVDMDAVSDMPDPNALNAIQGRVSGIQIGKSGGPGGSNIVRIRGFSNVSTNDPLYIIDGVPTQDGSIFNALNPADIASMQVLKDASAAAIYGSRANNGVIIVTTKSGATLAASTKTLFNVGYYVGFQSPRTETFPDMLSPQEQADYIWQRSINGGKTPSSTLYGSGSSPVLPTYLTKDGGVNSVNEADYKYEAGADNNPIRLANKQGTNWFEEIFRNSAVHNVDFSASRNAESSNFYFSTNYHSNDGILNYTNYTRFSTRINTSFKVNKFLRVGENFTFSYFENRGDARYQQEGGALFVAYRTMPIIPVRDIRGNYAGTKGGGLGNAFNPVADIYRNRNDITRNIRTLGNVFAEVTILKGLTFKSTVNFDLKASNKANFTALRLEDQEQLTTNSYLEGSEFGFDLTVSNVLNYNKTFGNHALKLLAGTEYIDQKYRYFEGTRQGYDSEDAGYVTLNSGGASGQRNSGYNTQARLFSLFGKVDYAFAGKYFITGIMRYDESSRFIGANRSKLFPSVGLAWQMSEEKFIKNANIFDNLKLRFAWGQTGNQQTPTAYPAYSTYGLNSTNNNYSIAGSGATIGLAPSADGNPDVRWEIASTFDIGLEMGFFQNKLNIELGYYNKNTDDMLVQVPRPATQGLADNPWVNVGSMSNEGFEVTIAHNNTLESGLGYNAAFTLSTNENKVTKLLDNEDAFIVGNDFRGDQPTRIQQGYPISYFYGYVVDGFYEDATSADNSGQANGQAGGFKYKDINGDGEISSEDRTYLGKPQPDFIASLNLGVSYKGLSLTMFMEMQQGNQVYNFTRYFTDLLGFPGAINRRALDFYDPARNNQNATVPYNSEAVANQNVASSYYVEDASFFRMRNIQLAYQLPSAFVDKLLKGGGIRVYFQVENAFVITEYSGLDPEVNVPEGSNSTSNNTTLGVDRGIYPNPRSFIFGVNLRF